MFRSAQQAAREISAQKKFSKYVSVDADGIMWTFWSLHPQPNTIWATDGFVFKYVEFERNDSGEWVVKTDLQCETYMDANGYWHALIPVLKNVSTRREMKKAREIIAKEINDRQGYQIHPNGISLVYLEVARLNGSPYSHYRER